LAFVAVSSHSVGMSRRGRRPLATHAQADEVRRLAAAGGSKRTIAAAVFGDARYHGRVERILRREQEPRPAQRPAQDASAASPTLPSFRELLNRHRERLAAADELPPLKEIELLMKLERQLKVEEMVERANALTRES
jgi:hypothetical protein